MIIKSLAGVPIPGTKRDLQQSVFVASSVINIPLWNDSCYRKLVMRMSGAVQTTFSGSPIADQQAALASLISEIRVVAPGGRVLKSIDPWVLRFMNLYSGGNLPERRTVAAASAQTPCNPTADGFAFGTTTQYLNILESLELSFEDKLARFGRDDTLFEARGLPTNATIQIVTNPFAKLQRKDDVVTITYGNNTLVIDVMTDEAAKFTSQTIMREGFQMWQPQGQVVNNKLLLPQGLKLRGIVLKVRDGDTTKQFSNTAITDVGISKDGGRTQVLKTTFGKIQAQNKASGMNSPYASNISAQDGMAFIDLLTDGDPNTYLDTNLGNVFLELSTAASGSGANYTNPLEVMIHMMDYYDWRSQK